MEAVEHIVCTTKQFSWYDLLNVAQGDVVHFHLFSFRGLCNFFSMGPPSSYREKQKKGVQGADILENKRDFNRLYQYLMMYDNDNNNVDDISKWTLERTLHHLGRGKKLVDVLLVTVSISQMLFRHVHVLSKLPTKASPSIQTSD